jgi:hypothetical protein
MQDPEDFLACSKTWFNITTSMDSSSRADGRARGPVYYANPLGSELFLRRRVLLHPPTLAGGFRSPGRPEVVANRRPIQHRTEGPRLPKETGHDITAVIQGSIDHDRLLSARQGPEARNSAYFVRGIPSTSRGRSDLPDSVIFNPQNAVANQRDVLGRVGHERRWWPHLS